jgi:hypothetical protein
MYSSELTLEEFNTQIRIRYEYAIANKTRIGLSADNQAKLTSLMGDESTPKTWIGDWVNYSDETKRTKPIRLSIKSLRKQLEKLMSAICDDIPKSVWTDDDRIIFGRKTGAEDPPSKPSKIEVGVVPSMISLGGGMLKCGCKSKTDQSRPSLAAGANAVIMAYRVDKIEYETDSEGEEPVSKVKFPPIYGPDDGTTKVVSSKATILLELGIEAAGCVLQYYLAYINTSHPEINGPWSGPFHIVIS